MSILEGLVQLVQVTTLDVKYLNRISDKWGKETGKKSERSLLLPRIKQQIGTSHTYKQFRD